MLDLAVATAIQKAGRLSASAGGTVVGGVLVLVPAGTYGIWILSLSGGAAAACVPYLLFRRLEE
jgi:hypothetical protein